MIPFYERLGYIQEGERFDEDGGEFTASVLSTDRAEPTAPHQKMVKSVNI